MQVTFYRSMRHVLLLTLSLTLAAPNTPGLRADRTEQRAAAERRRERARARQAAASSTASAVDSQHDRHCRASERPLKLAAERWERLERASAHHRLLGHHPHHGHIERLRHQLVEQRRPLNLTHVSAAVTIGIKTVSSYVSRRALVHALLRSIRRYYGDAIRIVVADDGDAARDLQLDPPFGAAWLPLPPESGLSAGRNAIVQTVQTPFVMIMDDDVVFDEHTKVEALLGALLRRPNAAVASGCYVDPLRLAMPNHLGVYDEASCFAHNFATRPGGHLRMEPVAVDGPTAAGGDAGGAPEDGDDACVRVDVAQNFLLGRTAVLRLHGWDERMKVGEHEQFFYGLYLNAHRVLSCPGVTSLHSHLAARPREYRKTSLRYYTPRYYQYFCKDYPHVATFTGPYFDLDCLARRQCTPDWAAEFVHAAPKICDAMRWDAIDDFSRAPQPLIPSADAGLFTPPSSAAPARSHVPLLALVFTQPSNAARRNDMRQAWLRGPWLASNQGLSLVPWRYAFVIGLSGNRTRSMDHAAGGASRRGSVVYAVGDLVLFRASNYDECNYRQLVYKTIRVFEWALASVSFGALLKCDDDSFVHVSRLWQWLVRSSPTKPTIANAATRQRQVWPHLYAGNVVYNGTVLRENGTANAEGHAFHPSQLAKWAVPASLFERTVWPPYASGGGYLLGPAAVAAIVRGAKSFERERGRLIPVEDAFVGVLAERSRLTPTHMPHFVDMTNMKLGRLSPSMLIHGKHRWVSADAWQRGTRNVSRVCNCAVEAPRLCTKQRADHGCWFVCCNPSVWVDPAPSRSPATTCTRSSRELGTEASRYLIWTNQRSASTTLCWALAQHTDVQCDFELLSQDSAWAPQSGMWKLLDAHQKLTAPSNSDDEAWINVDGSFYPRASGASSASGGPIVADEAAMCRQHVDAALDVYWSSYCRARACGFKVFPLHLACNASWGEQSHVGEEARARLGARRLASYLSQTNRPAGCGVKIIVLRRRSLRSEYVSARKAWLKDDWHRIPSASKGAAGGGGAVPPPAAGRACVGYRGRPCLSYEEYARQQTEWYAVAAELQREGLPVMHVATEDLFETRRKDAGRGGGGAGKAAGGRPVSELNLTVVNGIARFLEVAPVLRRADVPMAKMAQPDWWRQEHSPVQFLDQTMERVALAQKAQERGARRRGRASAPAPSKEPSREEVRCYLYRNPDIVRRLCRGDVAKCDRAQIARHLRHIAPAAGRMTSCELD